jgi:hypothetical protein
VENRLYQALDTNLGAEMGSPWFRPPGGFSARRFDMDNGDLALFAWTDGEAYWLGNTETPEALWRTDKRNFEDVPYELRRWAERELLAHLHEEAAWLADYPHLSWYFLPVFLSKDGRETSKRFFREHAAGFPGDPWTAIQFYEDFLSTGVLDGHRHVMAGKLGTSDRLNLTRMTAAMGEFNAAYLLHESGYDITPEAEVSTGHSIDFRASAGDRTALIEVTRPAPPARRSADSAVEALRRTAATKVNGQLDAHGGGVTLFVDCSSFRDADWHELANVTIEVGHRPAVIYRIEPDGDVEAYTKGSVPLELPAISVPSM